MSEVFVLLDDKKKIPGAKTYYQKDEIYFSQMNSQGWGVFFAVNEFEASPEQLVGSKTKRNEEFLVKMQYAYADLDIAKSGDGKTRQEKEDLKNVVIKALIEKCSPTLIIGTSNGVQPLWKLEDTPITAESKLLYNNVIKGIIEWSKAYQCKADGVFDVSRILRVPGYYHQKEEPYLCDIVHQATDNAYSLNYLASIFPYSIPDGNIKYKLNYTPESTESNVVFDAIEAIDFQELMKRAFSAVGRVAEFDGTGRLILDGRQTGTFQGRKDDRNYLASSSHEPFKGNRITAVGDILGITNKEAYRWITDAYNLNFSELSRHKKTEERTVVLEKLVEKTDYKLRYTWGTQNLNDNFAIIKRTDFIVIGASRGSGKTTFTFDMACKNALIGHKVLYISLEMEKEEIIADFARRHAGWTINEEYHYVVPSHKQDKFKDKLEDFKSIKNLYFEGVRRGDQITWDIVLKIIGKYEDLDLIVIDNLDLIEADSREQEWDKQKRVTKSMMNFTSAKKIPIILIHHQRKKGAAGKDYGMDELSGSGKIADNADRVVLITRNRKPDAEYPDKYCSKIHLHKARGYHEWSANVYFIGGTFIDNPPVDVEKVVRDVEKNNPNIYN